MKSLSVLGLLSLVLTVGCQQPTQRLNAPPQGETDNPSSMQGPFQAMVDNSIQADMSLADIHFAGDSAQLSGVGEYRLKRLAEICKTYGGEVRYDTQLLNDKLAQQRLERVEQYLAAAGCDMDKCSVRLGMAASAYMPAAQAVKAQQAGLASDEASGGGEKASGLPSMNSKGAGAGASK